jgi:signal transduction histidine kinase
MADQAALLSCLENILRNAIRYADKKITVSSYIEHDENQLVITISDDGKGITTGDIDKIFDAFYRPNLDRDRHSGGVGLGLSIAKKAVVIHSGKIWAENLKPQGFAIHIQLPLKKEST